MRTNLKVFRVKQNLTQGELAEKLGYTRACLSAIEQGKREGRAAFWNALQKAFSLDYEALQELRRNDE